MPAADSSPRINWALVRITTHGELWKLVAWSCGIYPDPDTYVGPRKAKPIDTFSKLGGDAAGYQPPHDEFHERVRTAARQVGEGRALPPVGSIPTDDLGYCIVRLADVAALAVKLGWDVPDEFAELAHADDPVPRTGNVPTTSAPVPIREQHKSAILTTIRALGHDPKNITPAPLGKAGTKKDVRDALPLTRDQFDKAWKKLRLDGEIVESAALKKPR